MRYLFSFIFLLAVGQVAAQPTITNFSPTSGTIGTPVTITGTNFSTTAASNIVWFGATKATVTGATSTQLTVTVPTGATYQPITVTTGGLTAYSNKPFVVTFAGATALGIGSFAAKVDFPTATPYSVSLGDLDGDGKPDLAVANLNNNSVSVFKNTSATGTLNTGSFAARVDFLTGAGPRSVSIGDLDGDGKPDLAVVNFSSHTVSVFKNTSSTGTLNTGSFAAMVDFSTGTNPYGVSIGDLDGDGKPDLVVANQSSATVSVFKNTSATGTLTTPSFAARVDFPTGGGPQSVSIADLDGDGKPDLVVANQSSATVSVLKNTSATGTLTTGSFAATVDFPTGALPQSVSIGDLDGDGKPDLAVANSGSNTVSVFKNTSTTGTLTTGSFALRVDFLTGANPLSISIGDLDGDGKPDLAVANKDSNTISVFKNTSATGTLTTASFAAKVDFLTGTWPVSVSIGDLDGDGKPDVALVNQASSTVSVLLNVMVTISSFTPTSAGSSTTVTITGTNFTGATAVSFGGTAATSFTVVSATSITAVVASGTSGSVSVTTPGGTVSSPGFTFISPPTITSFAPTSAASGATVTITGANFIGATAVSFGGTAASSFSVVSATSITAVVAAGTSGSVSVTTPGGTATQAGFTFIPAPTVTTYSPLNNATSVAANSNLMLTFSETMQKGTGNIIIKEGGTAKQTIAVTDASVTISGNIVTINPTDFTAGVLVNIEMAAGVFKDLSNNNYAGIITATAWNFTVATDAAPTVTTYSPSDNATGISASTNLSLTFSEAVQKGTGNILIREGATITQTIAVTDASVTVSGSTVTIDPANFTAGAAVNVQMPSGVIKDLANNNYAGIADATTWNFAVATIATDATPPSITDGTSTKVNQSEALTITANITDNESTISAATVEFRSIAAGGATTTRALSPTGNTFTTTIATTEIGELGIEYKLSATSADGTFTSGNFKTVAVNQNNGLVIPYSSFGNALANYKIISVPLELTANTMNDVFEELGAYDKTKWRMYRYDNGATTELSGTTPMLPGKGYWLIAKANPGKAINSGVGSTITTAPTTPYEIDLKADWNQIGNPYNFNLSWVDIVAANPGLALPVTLRVYTNDFIDGTRLNKMEGAFIKVNAAQKLKFPVVKNTSVNGRTSEDASRLENPLDQPDWQVYFKIAQGEVNNLISGFGMNTKATDSFDKFDGFNMPRFFETFLELNHSKKEGVDFYSSDIVAPRENHVWEFDIDSNQGESTIALSWDNSYFGNNNRELYLWDVAQQRAINMRLVNSYAFDKNLSKSFRAIYGSREFVKLETSVDKLVFHEAWPNPASDKVSVSFSLPHSAVNEQVSFALVDMLGRKIWSKENNFNGGYHEVAFERSSETGSGLFILMVSNQSITKQARVVFR